jgi:hypothetical protein
VKPVAVEVEAAVAEAAAVVALRLHPDGAA